MKILSRFLAISALTALSIVSCGGEGANPDAGLRFYISKLAPTSDGINTTCTLAALNVVKADYADITFTNKAVGKADPIDIVLENYTIDYTPLDKGAPKLKASANGYRMTDTVPGNGALAGKVMLASIDIKDQFLSATTGTTAYGSTFAYKVHYLFTGHTVTQKAVSTEGETSMTMGNTYIVACP